MASITPLAVAALGLLAERPMHPYEMYQLLVDREEDRLLKVRPGSLYHAVDRLAESGLVEPMGTERSGNRPERTRFRITDDGRRALAERLTEMLAQPAADYPEFPLAISQAHNLPLDEVLACLQTRIKRLTIDRSQYQEGESFVRERGVPRRFWIDVQYQQARYDAEIRWLQGLIDELRSGTLSWDEEHEHPPMIGSRTDDGDGGDDPIVPRERPGAPVRPMAVGAQEDDGVRPGGRRRGRPSGGSAGPNALSLTRRPESSPYETSTTSLIEESP